MFGKLLVANRGEIAVRIIRACRELGIKTVAVYSEADADGLHAALADEKVCLPGFKPVDTYLNMEKVIQAARETGAGAVHPGYGYLAENEAFALRCGEAGIFFIGPRPENIRLAGNKLRAKKQAAAAGLPVIPGCERGICTVEEAVAAARDTGFPVILKATAGGGGRGMRICSDEEELREEFPIARAEAGASFGDVTLYVEKLLRNPRHIEVQVLGDSGGRVIHLGERECSVQRRYQKLIEESPSPALDDDLRDKIGAAAVRLAESINYFNAGTVEFMLDANNNFYFMEINARLQVEHPVTEMVTGIDIVKEQVRLALGERVKTGVQRHRGHGWALECRINAEDPEKFFLPSPGLIECYRAPGGFGVRLDTHVYQGYRVPPYYDSLLAKLVAWGRDRAAAICTMRRALDEFTLEPVKTTIPLHKRILADQSFQKGTFNTSLVNRFVPADDDD
ncbi:acetyl-CoA carboxylase biotin carboxylase subunit [Desulfotruncus alcoholivorax]|uniref:acetyl-CoA carboxylase biotin carboxylase subunit n=1 Tax=Desulfotruncus alcoholivorax TaxID=265477 RepID=UPI0004010982|nr:acetyl-CoA carboxylase biotin carboxylase subunit [Desulfotruncus alcoholivorax]